MTKLHPRVLELIRERMGPDTVRDKTDEELTRAINGTILLFQCSLQHFREEVGKVVIDMGHSLKRLTGRRR
jgi:hypothetical protein